MAVLVAIYTRVSREDTEEPHSTRRQERACREYARSRKWEVADVWEDVDVSAYGRGIRRPAFNDLMRIVSGGQVQGVLVWKLDRLVRRMVDFERFWVRCDKANVFLASATEPIDTTTELGLAVVRILVTFANVESTSIGLRLQSRMKEKAQAGIPLVTSRVFGFDRSFTRLIDDEAELIREASRRFLAGESCQAIADDWRSRQIPTADGRLWTGPRLDRLLKSPRMAGDNTFHGEVVKKACLPVILDPLVSAEIRSRLADHHWTRHSSQAYVLSSGLLRCGICERNMYGITVRRRGGTAMMRTYQCTRSGHCLSINAELAEHSIISTVFNRLEHRGKRRPTLSDPRNAPAELAEAYERHASSLCSLSSDYYVHRRLTREEWETARDGLQEQLRGIERLHKVPSTLEARGRAGIKNLRNSWDSLDIAHQRDIVASELRFATILPSANPGRVDPRRIVPNWWDGGQSPSESAPIAVAAWDDSSWMSSREVAKLLGISASAVVQMARREELPAAVLRGKFRYRRCEIEAIVAKLQTSVSPEVVARRTGVRKRLVMNWIRSGVIPAIKIRQVYRIYGPDMATFAEQLVDARQKFVRTSEAARLLDVKPAHIRFLIVSGRLTALPCGRTYLLLREDVEHATIAPRTARRQGRREPFPVEPAVMNRIVTAHRRGVPLRGIATQLNVDGIPTASGTGRWHSGRVRVLLDRATAGPPGDLSVVD